jgi:opacity protein-like surface antigen
MKKIIRLAIGGAFLSLSALPSFASCEGGKFSGRYGGVTVGTAGLDSRRTFDQEFSFNSHGSSAAIGGIFGVARQCDRVVVGAEADLSYLGLKSDFDFGGQISLLSKINSFASLRGKLGVAVRDDLLVYGTAGWALADVSSTITSGSFSQTDHKSKTGFVWGGGLELARDDRTLIRAEALRVDMGRNTYDYFDGEGSTRVDWKNSFWVARVGVTFKLGERAERAAPLK